MGFKKIKIDVNNLNKGQRMILIIIVCLILIGSFTAVVIQGMGKALDPNDNQSINVTIEEGWGTGQIAELLREKGIIDNPKAFRMWSRLKGYDSDYKAGTYSLSPAMSFKELADILVGGKVSTITFTIPEGYTIYQVADTLSERGLIDRERFVDLLENGTFDYDFLDGAQKNKNHLEGYLFPNTYTLPEGAKEEDFINVMLNQFELEVTDEHYEKAREMGLSMNEVIIVASIIEREVNIDDERPLVASVIYNRLEKGMALQMCSTVQYVLGKQKAVLSNADTQIESSYNTYLNPGLPPGPICSPGLASIEAALNPADTDYLYFVLSEKLDGSANFSDNYEKFQKDANAYYAAVEAAS